MCIFSQIWGTSTKDIFNIVRQHVQKHYRKGNTSLGPLQNSNINPPYHHLMIFFISQKSKKSLLTTFLIKRYLVCTFLVFFKIDYGMKQKLIQCFHVVSNVIKSRGLRIWWCLRYWNFLDFIVNVTHHKKVILENSKVEFVGRGVLTVNLLITRTLPKPLFCVFDISCWNRIMNINLEKAFFFDCVAVKLFRMNSYNIIKFLEELHCFQSQMKITSKSFFCSKIEKCR